MKKEKQSRPFSEVKEDLQKIMTTLKEKFTAENYDRFLEITEEFGNCLIKNQKTEKGKKMNFKYRVKGGEKIAHENHKKVGAKFLRIDKYKLKGSPVLKDGKKYKPGEIIELTLQEALYLDEYVERLTEEEANALLSEI